MLNCFLRGLERWGGVFGWKERFAEWLGLGGRRCTAAAGTRFLQAAQVGGWVGGQAVGCFQAALLAALLAAENAAGEGIGLELLRAPLPPTFAGPLPRHRRHRRVNPPATPTPALFPPGRPLTCHPAIF